MFDSEIVNYNQNLTLMIKKFYALALLGFASMGLNAQSASPYCSAEVTHFNIPAEIPSKIYMSIANVDATSMVVEIQSADADAVDVLIIANASGATISAPNTTIAGRISRTLTWANPPATVDLNVLWSKVSFPGNWQLNQADITVAFADTCGNFNPPPPPPPPVPANITFQVDMNNYVGTFTTVNVNGTFNGWCGGCNPLTDPDMDGIYEVTIPLMPGIIEYKFTVDGWADQENLIPGSSCSVTGAGFTNRLRTLTADEILPAVCWNSCVSCANAPVSKMVTFTVDMADYNGAAYGGVFLNGDFNGWCGACNSMTDMGNDVWSVSIPLTSDSIDYKFTLDGWNGQESLAPGSSCTRTASGYTNRHAKLLGDTVLNEVCWNLCTDCMGAPTAVDVTFQVNMNNYMGVYSSVNVNGTFNGWCGGCTPMLDPDGDGIFEVTVSNIPVSGVEYKFTVDGWNDQESLTPGDPCVLTTGANTNRYLVPTADTVLNSVCWSSCSDCGAAPMNNYDVTFQVNMNAECAFDSVDVAGDFNGWPNTVGDMLTDNGNGSWSTTLNMLEGTVSYKFRKWYAGSVVWESITNRSITFSSDTSIAEVCFNDVALCAPIAVISGISKVSNPRTYRVDYVAPVADKYSLQLKGPSDVNWSTPKAWSANVTSQNFQAKVFAGETMVRIGTRTAGVWSYSCETSFMSDCKLMTVSAIELITPFCEGDSAQLKAIAAGGFRAKTFMWSTGETTRFIYGQQGQTYQVVATDGAGCTDSASVTVSALTTDYTPSGFAVSKPSAVTFMGTWTPANLATGVTLVGYRMAYRRANVGGAWMNTALSTNTTATVDFTGSGNVSANYEFAAFARVNDNGSIYNTEYSCTDRVFYNGSGAKWGASSANALVGLSIYPNPTQNIVTIQSEGAMQSVELTDMNGKRLMFIEVDQQNSTTLNLETLSSGIYLINVVSEDGIATERVSKL